MKITEKLVSIFLLPIALISCGEKSGISAANHPTSDTIHFGKVAYSDTARKTFFLTNRADSAIRVLRVENACGCTSSTIRDSVIRAHDSIGMLITYTPAFNKDSGHVVKFMTIRTNEDFPFRNLVLKADVQ